jgi:hypothetical protein
MNIYTIMAESQFNPSRILGSFSTLALAEEEVMRIFGPRTKKIERRADICRAGICQYKDFISTITICLTTVDYREGL